jgi:putative flavoprotein involved in K+ transport
MTSRLRRRVSTARTVAAVIIGAGHAGLAMSRCLSERSIDHVILERGQVANSWRHERWDSLRLLTPNWQCRLPGLRYAGPDPDGFMTMPEVIDFIEGYSQRLTAPVHTWTAVTHVRPIQDGYLVTTDRGDWRCRAVVIASGAFALPTVPAMAGALPDAVASITARDYRNPEQLADGGVLVVGASATGLQLADEIHRAGRPVTLAVGEHVRMPRLYRGLDIQWWMDATGVLDQRFDEVDDIARARRVPSPQLAGTPDRRTLDLNALSDRGVRLVGRLAGVRDHTLQFSGALRNHCALADLKLSRLLDGFDAWERARAKVDKVDKVHDVGAPERFAPTRVDAATPLTLDLSKGEVRSVVWATGFKPDYSWLDLPVFDARGRIRHDGGVVAGARGLYVMGLSFLRRRKSSFIHGAEDDARELSDHLCMSIAASRAAPALERAAASPA